MPDTSQSLETAERRLAKRRIIAELTAPQIGKVFNRLTVTSKPLFSEGGFRRLNVRCSCGTEKSVQIQKLVTGATKSCGCLAREMSAERKTTHGHTNNPVYRIWLHMMGRCYDPANKSYTDYGARGISVDKCWHTFSVFYSDVGDKPRKTDTLERVNNELGYVKGNVVWADRTVQANNRRSSVRLDYKGSLYTYRELSVIAGIDWKTVHSRITFCKWTVERAVETPLLSRSEHANMPPSTTPPATRHKLYPQQPTTTPS